MLFEVRFYCMCKKLQLIYFCRKISLLSYCLMCCNAIQICTHTQTHVCVRMIQLNCRLMPLLFFSDDCRWQVTCWCFVYCMHFHDAANYVTVNCLPHDAWFPNGTVLSHTVHSLLRRSNDNMKWLHPIGVGEKLKRKWKKQNLDQHTKHSICEEQKQHFDVEHS